MEGNNEYVRIGPFGKNLLRWHFSVVGVEPSRREQLACKFLYAGGVYHGRVLLPKVYPGSPPRVLLAQIDSFVVRTYA